VKFWLPLIGLATLALGGCATMAYPPLYTAPARNVAGAALTAAILEDARLAQIDYAARYARAGRASDLSALPLVAAAAATAALLYGKAGEAAVFGVGLASGAYVATRGVLAPPRMTTLYLQAHRALGCVRTGGGAFAGDTAQRRFDAFGVTLTGLRSALADAEQAALLPAPSRASAVNLAVHLATQARLRDQILVAYQIEAAAEREAAAFETAPAIVQDAVEAIHLTVATRGREGREVDTGSLTQALLAAATSSVTKPPADAGNPPMLAASTSQPPGRASVGAAFYTLTLASSRMRTTTPGYVAMLAKVATCPQQAR